MGEYQERPKRSSSNNNESLPPIQAYEQYMYGGGFSQADRSPLPITPELIKQLEKEDEELFERFGSRQAYNKLKKKEILKSTEATLLSGDKQDGLSGDETSISDERDTASISNEKRDIAGFSQAEKLLEVLNLTIQKLPSALGSQLKALINPTSIAVMVGVLGAYTASHAVGVGFIADAVMGVSAGLFLGWQAVDVAKDLWGFVSYVNATTEEELDKAAGHLAKAIMTVGFDVILGILTKKAAGKVSRALERTDVAPQRRRTPVRVDELKQVDVVHAHSDDMTPSRVNDANNADKTPSTDIEITPTNANNVKYPEGISYRQDLPKHLQTFDTFTQKNGIGGAHNLDAFNQAVAEKSIRITSKIEHPTIKGIYQIKYEVPKLDKQLNPTGNYKRIKQPKTVYDPAIHSNEKILQLGQEAAAKGLDDAIAKNEDQFTEIAGGIRFRVYVDLDTKIIRNVHPDFNNGT